MAHTPAPWAVKHERWIIATRAEHEGEILIGPTYWMETAKEEAAANARLIAAAPDLLAIVKEMVEVIEWSERRIRPHWDGAVSDNSTIGRARAAIAKAELSPDPSPGIS